MKTNELMIDDMVQEWNNDHTESHIVKVEKVLREGVYDKFNHFHDADWIEPIPLTDEFLDKNGFEIVEVKGQKYYRYCAYYLYPDYCGGFDYGRWHNKIGFVPSTSTRLRYVHELQHVLRWIGYDKADNLKVE